MEFKVFYESFDVGNQLKVKTHLTTSTADIYSWSAGEDYDLLRQLANYTDGSGKE